MNLHSGRSAMIGVYCYMDVKDGLWERENRMDL